MIQLTANESRVLGVLIEKALTTPDQYPLSLNAATNGSNQKNNRDPVLTLTEDQVFDALETLRGKGLVVRVDVPGNRVPKYRHNAIDTLHVRTGEAAIIAELLLRGPQTLGELRGRATRMSPIESLNAAGGLLEAMMSREEPLAKIIAPLPGSRAERYVQLLCPDAHPIDSPARSAQPAPASASSDLSDRVASLEERLNLLQATVDRLTAALGETEKPQA